MYRKQQPEARTVLSVVGLCFLSANNSNMEKVVAAAICTVLAMFFRNTLFSYYSNWYEIFFFFLPAVSVLSNCACLRFALHCSITLWLRTQRYSPLVKVSLVMQGWSIWDASFSIKAFRNKSSYFQQRSKGRQMFVSGFSTETFSGALC